LVKKNLQKKTVCKRPKSMGGGITCKTSETLKYRGKKSRTGGKVAWELGGVKRRK